MPVRRRIARALAPLGCVLLVIACAAGVGARPADAAPGSGQVSQACPKSFRAESSTLFNDPSGSTAAQRRILRHLVKLIDCTPSRNPDGSQASIHASFYSLSYAPVRASLVDAAERGVSVHVLANSHADRFHAWQDLVDGLGSDTSADSFAITCWQGCLGPRWPPAPGGPTAWYRAEATSGDSPTMEFTDHSRPGAAPIVTWAWDFGDGTHATGVGPHRKTYDAEGRYSTSLTVVDARGRSHNVAGSVTVPDSLEPMIPSLHSKLFLFSAVGSGSRTERWVSVYGSGNPTHNQARLGFNNLNVSVGRLPLYRALDRYFGDLLAGSRGLLLTPSYDRTVTIPADAASGEPRMVLHFLPSAAGDLQLDVLRSILCRYLVGGHERRTTVQISMFAFTRVELAAELWRMAYERGCVVDVVYSQMTQRLRDTEGGWLPAGMAP